MKSLWIIPLAILLQANGCENKQQPVSLLPQPVANTEKNKPCIDSSRVKPDAICPMNWQPGCARPGFLQQGKETRNAPRQSGVEHRQVQV